MIYIVKKHEPRELTEYRESESSTGVRPTYDSMSSDLHEYVLSKLVEEQGGLCAYCMCRIPETDKKTGSTLKCTIEHIEPQSLTRGTENLKKELEYSNFLAVCSGNENRGALCCFCNTDSIPSRALFLLAFKSLPSFRFRISFSS